MNNLIQEYFKNNKIDSESYSDNDKIKYSISELTEKINKNINKAKSEGMIFESKIPKSLLKNKYLKYKKKYLNLKMKYTMKGGGDISKTSRIILVKAEWCGHCQAFKEEWGKIQKELKSDTIEFITLDSDADKKMIEKYEVKGYPTILVENKDKIVEFTGKRNVNGIKKFIEDTKL